MEVALPVGNSAAGTHKALNMSITLNTKVYSYDGFTNQAISQYSDRSSGVPAGFSPLTAKVEDGGPASNTKVRWKLKVPVVAAEDSECSCAGSLLREYIVDIVFTVPPGSTTAERTDIMDRVQDLAANAQFVASLVNLLQPST